ncbi:MAG: FAD-dependent oxidoreductase [Gammaproteobacteria bacterium]|nr:MAG: FAD-dependent oxidoreductase [Gammaproteobacteria bacterium]
MKRPVLVVGAGWAGLSCALALAEAGVRVIVLEAAPAPGGRARSLQRRGREYDNGQHLLLCACSGVIDLLTRLDVDPEAAFLRLPLQLRFHAPGGECLHLVPPAHPWPLHLVRGVLEADGFGPRERLALLASLPELLFRTPPAQATVATWLEGLAQPPALCRRFWDVLCVSALNTEPERASARLFVQVLRETFRPPARRSDLWIPRRPLSALFPVPAVRRLAAAGGRVLTRHRVVGLSPGRGGLRVHCRNGACFEGPVVLAVPPWEARRLLAHLPGMGALAARLGRLRPAPVTTLWLEYAEPVALPAPLVGLLEAPFQFVFDHGPLGHPGRIVLVGSGPAANRELDRTAAPERLAHRLLADRCPGWPRRPPRAWRIRERRATFLATPEAERLRPGPATPLSHLVLAGDWTATGLPATLEGAVRSGRAAAARLLRTSV